MGKKKAKFGTVYAAFFSDYADYWVAQPLYAKHADAQAEVDRLNKVEGRNVWSVEEYQVKL